MSDADLQAASAGLVRAAIESGNPLPGTRGFAGRMDGALIRDVLGRYPVYHERGDVETWGADPTELADPEPVPAGHRVEEAGRHRVWSLPDPEPVSLERGVGQVRSAIDTALPAVDTDGLAVAFSGGVDSALLAARLEAPLYVVGFPDSHDIEAAQSAAATLERDLTVVTLDHETLERTIPPVARATGRHNAMDVSIALPLYCLAEAADADGYDRVALGQGADELFGGYAKVAKAPEDPRVDATTVRGARREVLETLPDQLPRDVLAVRAGGAEPACPLLDDRVVEAALSLPGAALVADTGERKQALRLAARSWLPDGIAFRAKKAMQYGSLVSRELDRLAREAGFKRRQDDHVGAYVDSVLD